MSDFERLHGCGYQWFCQAPALPVGDDRNPVQTAVIPAEKLNIVPCGRSSDGVTPPIEQEKSTIAEFVFLPAELLLVVFESPVAVREFPGERLDLSP